MKIGFQELLIVFIVALVVVGPDKLPYYAKKFGQAMAQFKKIYCRSNKRDQGKCGGTAAGSAEAASRGNGTV